MRHDAVFSAQHTRVLNEHPGVGEGGGGEGERRERRQAVDHGGGALIKLLAVGPLEGVANSSQSASNKL